MSEPTAVIVLAAGAGTRMKSRLPKVLHQIGGRSLLAHALHAAAAIAPDRLVTVVGHDRTRVSEAVDTIGADLAVNPIIAVQETQSGTGDAVRAGLQALPTNFRGAVVVTAADVPLLDGATLDNLLALHREGDGAAVTLLTSTADDPTGYGRVLRTQDGEVTEIVEQKDATEQQRAITEVNSGIYAFDAAELRDALGHLSTDNAQGELYLTDVVAIARLEGKTVRANHIDDALLVAGCNDRVQLAQLGKELNRRIVERHMLAGVTVVDPDTTWIDVGVTIGRDVTLAPGIGLHGATSIDDDATVGPDTSLTDVTVGARASVVRTHGSQSSIGDDATVGPFTYLRPGTVLGEAGKLGAFVETKNSTIGSGSKVPHLTYVGDATVGEHSNIGCSSVFVNYDGVHKSRTVVGDHVRIASDTMLVAPVNVGDGAYTGAGTVVRENVPPGALAVSGGKQRNIENWVLEKRPGTAAAEAARSAQAQASKDGQQ